MILNNLILKYIVGTKYEGSQREKRALNAFIKLSRASESVMNAMARVIGAHGLTDGQFGAMETLLHLGPLNQCELGRKLLRSGGNVTMIVDNLEKNGYVIRSQDPDDRRSNIVSLTAAGEELIRVLFPKVLARIVAVMDALDADEQDSLAAMLKRLGLGAAAVDNKS